MAYGAIGKRPPLEEPLEARIYPLSSRAVTDARAAVVTVPFDIAGGDAIDSALEFKLYKEFNMSVEIDGGRTYPQENLLTAAEFRAYFVANILILGVFVSSKQVIALNLPQVQDAASIPVTGLKVPAAQLSKIELGRSKLGIHPDAWKDSEEPIDWHEKCAFSYYVKPNYPGRSSHLCNAGFVVPTAARGLGLGQMAGRSFLYYGPRSGYRGSIFNLVYTNNEASTRIWQALGYQVVGTIPEAGRLKKKDGSGEEFVDAYVVYADFKKIGQKDD